jgi:hypothetical protein
VGISVFSGRSADYQIENVVRELFFVHIDSKKAALSVPGLPVYSPLWRALWCKHERRRLMLGLRTRTKPDARRPKAGSSVAIRASSAS